MNNNDIFFRWPIEHNTFPSLTSGSDTQCDEIEYIKSGNFLFSDAKFGHTIILKENISNEQNISDEESEPDIKTIMDTILKGLIDD